MEQIVSVFADAGFVDIQECGGFRRLFRRRSVTKPRADFQGAEPDDLANPRIECPDARRDLVESLQHQCIALGGDGGRGPEHWNEANREERQQSSD